MDSAQSAAPITVMLMTKDEENNIAAAMGSFPKQTKFVLYDSFSSDRTVEIAKGLGASVVQRKFDNWSAHQNWGAQNIDFGNPWVYYCDADERMTPELWAEIIAAVANSGEHNAFEMRRKDMFMGRWIAHSSFYPCWFVRLYRPAKIHWERLVNPVTVVDGRVGRLTEHFIHYPFSKGISFWFQRHIGYADFEAQELLAILDESIAFGDLIGANDQKRRRALKQLFYRMPLRPMIKFSVLYLLRRGFLDGRAGFDYAIMQSIYEYMISLRVKEIVRTREGFPT